MARKALERLCDKNNHLVLLAVFEKPRDALDFLAKEKVDLIWLDVEMPELNGFEFLENLSIMPYIVMTTTETKYAFDAYQYQVVDYLQKPITLPRFNIAVEKVLEMQRKTQALPQATTNDIYVKAEGRYIRIALEEILYLENIGDYVKINTSSQVLTVYATMKSLQEKLGNSFLRVHRSFIVNLNKIVDIEENTLVIDTKVIPISRANKTELMNCLNMI
jgi:DNA-binding LytR/AlgR family response regulator